MDIRYTTSLDGITPDKLVGFFSGWRRPLSPEAHLRVLRGSRHVVLAMDERTGRVVGFINALTDEAHSAFIPLLEVLPEYRRKGIGRELVRRMLHELRNFPCIDLTCDPALQPFYEKCGMRRSVGMVVRNYDRTGRPGAAVEQARSV
ncbi:MAG: GNAT family N-acetyltransferase [Planctomycetes bacterium]|nr:GNAT family N-acetyltransferase [Planctomycetota bacterium]